MIRYREIPPPDRLRGMVRSFWILEQDGGDGGTQRIVPDGHAELILNWGRPFEAWQDGRWRGQPRCFLAGQIEGPLLLRPNGAAKMLGIGFEPHGAAMALRHPMHELRGRFTPVEDLSRRLACGLERAIEAADPVAAVEAALVEAQADTRGGDAVAAEAVRRIRESGGAANVGLLAREMGLSTRQLERRFQAAVGLAPKVFGRIQRFTRVFASLERPGGDWAGVAAACGYYDQAHLIRDCRQLCGQTPAALLAGDADLARHFYSRLRASHSYNTALRAAV